MPAPSDIQSGKAKPVDDAYAGVTSVAGGGGSTGLVRPDANAADPDEIEYGGLGGDNAGYYDQEYNPQGEGTGSWQDYLMDRLLKEVPSMAESFGENPVTYKGFVQRHMSDLLTYVDGMAGALLNLDLPGGPTNLTMTTQGLETLYTMGMSYLAGRDQRLQDYWIGTRGEAGGRPKGGGGGGGGRGSRRLTADEIRANFDLDQLAADARDIWRGTLLDEPKDARGMASAYVEAIVANPDQKLDFKTFIEKRAEGTARYASLFRNKPDGLTTQQYLAPFLSMAQQMARPKEATNIAAGGAQLGADPNAFRSRLNRTNAATTSAPFISSMEQRMSGLRKVLKG